MTERESLPKYTCVSWILRFVTQFVNFDAETFRFLGYFALEFYNCLGTHKHPTYPASFWPSICIRPSRLSRCFHYCSSCRCKQIRQNSFFAAPSGPRYILSNDQFPAWSISFDSSLYVLMIAEILFVISGAVLFTRVVTTC